MYPGQGSRSSPIMYSYDMFLSHSHAVEEFLHRSDADVMLYAPLARFSGLGPPPQLSRAISLPMMYNCGPIATTGCDPGV